MFEREMRESSFLKRWAIVRTLRQQSVAEHSYFVAMYANDLCIALNVPAEIHIRVLQYALWHDAKDELFTGDIPGPQKRALVSDRASFDRILNAWSNHTFELLDNRSGKGGASPEEWAVVKQVVKVADWMDAAMEMATEAQLGNRNASVLMPEQKANSVIELRKLCDLLNTHNDDYENVMGEILGAMDEALNGVSSSPFIASVTG